MKITKAVFPVAGMGTRFLPATKASPKEMLTVVDKPLIQYAVEEAVLAHEFKGVRYDCGSKLGYLQANVELGLKHAEVGAAFGRYLRGLRPRATK